MDPVRNPFLSDGKVSNLLNFCFIYTESMGNVQHAIQKLKNYVQQRNNINIITKAKMYIILTIMFGISIYSFFFFLLLAPLE